MEFGCAGEGVEEEYDEFEEAVEDQRPSESEMEMRFRQVGHLSLLEVALA